MPPVESPPKGRDANAVVAVDSVLCPTEHSRFVLAVSASTIAIGLFVIVFLTRLGGAGLVVLLVGLPVVLGSAWLGLQIRRAALLGSYARVTEESLPEVHAVLEDVRRRLDYHKRVDVYVSADANPSTWMTSYLGTQIIVLEVGLVAALLEEEEKRQLTFLLARYVGAMKVRGGQMEVLLRLLGATKVLPFVKLFILPYYRATLYSGDQIGLACCGDLGAALGAIQRLMVGKDLAPELRSTGVVPQAELARVGLLPRYAQLRSAEPHLLNRYLNLLFFAAEHKPESYSAFHGSLDEENQRRLARLRQASPHVQQRESWADLHAASVSAQPRIQSPARPTRPAWPAPASAAPPPAPPPSPAAAPPWPSPAPLAQSPPATQPSPAPPPGVVCGRCGTVSTADWCPTCGTQLSPKAVTGSPEAFVAYSRWKQWERSMLNAPQR